MVAQVPFGTQSFAENPDPRCACVLLLDTSGSMAGEKIRQLNLGIKTLKDELMGDPLAQRRVELAVITFGPVAQVVDFQTADQFQPPELKANGDTPMGAAIERAVEIVRQRKDVFKQNGVAYYRPWIFMITDGEPTDAFDKAKSLIREGETSSAFAFFAVGVGSANMDKLKEISHREPLLLNGLAFRELFQWLSTSMKSVSHSKSGTEVRLPSPSGWTSV